MWGSVETTVKLGLTGVTGFAIACVVIETAGAVIGGGLTGGGDGYAYLCTRTVVEFLLALYVADFVTGLIHMLLDFQTVNNDALRLHVETTVDGVKAFEETALFTEADEHDQYLWNFHSHHEAVFPSSDSQLELFMQLFWYVRVVWPLFFLAYHYGYAPEATSRVWLTALIVGLPSQQTHFLAHARNRGLLKDYPLLEKLQDWRVILHPDAHQKHHEEFNCNFCILNGWANGLMNKIAVLLTHFGALDAEPPSARNRRERAERAAKKTAAPTAAAPTAAPSKTPTAPSAAPTAVPLPSTARPTAN